MNTNRLCQHRGMALLMVLFMVALCSVLGYAMLWGASTNAQISDNAVMAAQADSLAESGVALGTYYLRYPANAPAGFLGASDTYTATNVTLGNNVDGYIDLTVVRDPEPVPDPDPTTKLNDYTITAKGVARDGELQIAKTLVGKVHLETAFSNNYALSIGGSQASISGMTVNGMVQSSGNIEVGSSSWIFGVILAPLIELTSTGYYNSTQALSTPDPVVPDWNEIKQYGPTYTYNGHTYNAQTISNPLISPPSANTTTNPLKVFYSAGDLAVINSSSGPSSFTVNGTLVVNGTMSVGAALNLNTRTVTISPAAGMPALLVKEKVNYLGMAKTIKSNGLTWIGQGIQSPPLALTTSSVFNVTGGLMVDSWPSTKTFFGSSTITYDSTKVQVPDFTTVSNQLPSNISVRSFR